MVELGLMANMQIDEKYSLNIFEMSTESNEPKKKLVNKELQMFGRFEVDVKDMKCPLEWVGETWMFVSNYNISWLSNFWHCWLNPNKNWNLIFSLAKKCQLQLNNLDKLTIVIKKILDDLGMDYSSPFTLIELIVGDATLEEELKQYEGEFERDEF